VSGSIYACWKSVDASREPFYACVPCGNSLKLSFVMVCPTWKWLLDECQAAARWYDAAVTATSGLAGDDFAAARERALRAKDEYLAAEHDLNEHERRHSCLEGFVKTQSA
jgi:hypothetical protein